MIASAPHHGEHCAREARAGLLLGDAEPIGDIVATIEDGAGVPVFLAPLPGEIAGLAHRVDGRWYVVGDSFTRPSGRLRFTLAHEFGHVWMGHRPSVDDANTLTMRGGSGSDPNEVDANYFAAEFLMPRVLVEDEFRAWESHHDGEFLRHLASKAGTTTWVSFFRLRTCGLLDWTQADSLEAEIRAGMWRAAARNDLVEGVAGTGETRLPDAHLRRLAEIEAREPEA